LQRRFDRLHTDVFFQGHGAKANGGNAGAMSFNHLHHNLLATALGKRSAEGREECPAAAGLPTGVALDCWDGTSSGCVERPRRFSNRAELSNTLNHKLFAQGLTLE